MCAPHTTWQGPKPLPFDVVNGTPGYINLLDALNAWQARLERERRRQGGREHAHDLTGRGAIASSYTQCVRGRSRESLLCDATEA